MVTDVTPRAAKARREFEASDALARIELPPPEPLQAATRALAGAVATGERTAVARAGAELLAILTPFYEARPPALRVLGVRPHRVREGRLSYELFGDYTFDTQVIRVWLRTAILGKVTTPRGLLNTLLHELAHHLDVQRLGWPSTPHTRGFYARVDTLYHHALATPPEERRPLVWVPMGTRWRVDWRKLRR